jgi:hypothetical protein
MAISVDSSDAQQASRSSKRSSRAQSPRRCTGGLCAVSLSLVVACQALVDYDRSPAASEGDSGTEMRAGADTAPAPGGPMSSVPISGADEQPRVPTPEPGGDPTLAGGPEQPMGPVGSACTRDADCSQAQPLPLTCITSQFDSFPGVRPTGSTEQPLGGAAGGYCSRTCEGPGECGVGALCVNHPGVGAFCYSACSLTAATLQCVDGGPQACASVGDPGGACYPMCRSHEQCGPGRFCDASSGLCVAEVQDTGGGIGAPCTLDSQATDCRSGQCVYEIATGNGICTALCRFGDVDCGAAVGEAALGSVCLSDDPSPGAVGSCYPLCDSDADCERSDYCRVGSPVAGRQGVCRPPIDPISGSSGSESGQNGAPGQPGEAQ